MGTTTEKVAPQETNDDEENVLENNYDEILDAVNTIFGSGTTEDVNEGEVKVIATTEVEPLATEEPLPITTILPSVPTAPTTTTTATTTTEAATTTESTSTTSETATSESSSAVSTVDIVTEAATPFSVSSSTDVPTEPKTDDSKIHFRDDGPVRDFTKRIFVDDGLVDARRKAIEARRKAASDA